MINLIILFDHFKFAVRITEIIHQISNKYGDGVLVTWLKDNRRNDKFESLILADDDENTRVSDAL